MSKTFRYTKFAKYHYCEFSDEWEEDGDEFDYEVEDRQLLPEIVDLLFNDYFADQQGIDEKLIKEKLSNIIEENYLIDTFADQYEDTLKEIFQDEALDFYDD